MISGDPRSGKSWIAGLLAEQLMEQGYRICIVDPEGDYAQIAQQPKILAFGHDMGLPAPSAVARLLAREELSTVLTISSLVAAEQLDYVDQLLAALQETRDGTGCPHWLVIDEAHYFFHEQSPCLKYLESPTASFCLVTYRPSLLATQAYGAVGAHIITSTNVEEERYFMTKVLQSHDWINTSAHDALEALEMPRAGFLLRDPASPWRVFTPASRITPHTHHARKYADTRLSDDKAFRFLNAGAPLAAHNIVEFHRALQSLPAASLRHHLVAGDFSRWVDGVLGDQLLANGIRKLERATAAGATPDQSEILAHIEDHYLIQQASG